MLFALMVGCAGGARDALPLVEGGLQTCALGAAEGEPAPALPLTRSDGSATTLEDVRRRRPALVAVLPGACGPECDRVRMLLLGWERQYPDLVGVAVSDAADPWAPASGPTTPPRQRGGTFVADRPSLDAWTDALTAPRLFVVAADGTVALRRDGFVASDARAVADALRWVGNGAR